MSHEPISLASVITFIDDNLRGGALLGGGSFDARAGAINHLFDFASGRGGSRNAPLYLDPTTGE